MNKRTVVSLVVLFIGLMVLIAFLEAAVKTAISKRESQEKPNIKYVPETISEEQKEKEEAIDDAIDKLYHLFQERDFEAIYGQLNDLYKEAKYPTYEIFVDEMSHLITEDTQIELSKRINHPVGYYAVFTLDDVNKIYVFVDNMDSDDLKIKLDRIYEINQFSRPDLISDEVNIVFGYCFNYVTQKGYTITVQNQLNRPVEFSLAGSYVYSTAMSNLDQYDIVDELQTTIPARDSVGLEMQFNVPFSVAFPPDKLWLEFMVNGKRYHKIIDVSFEDYTLGEE